MKKSLILAGMLCIGYANAQTTETYEGRVGINTAEPSATMSIKSKTGTTNTTKNLELENANGTKLVTVLDNGKLGINQDKPTSELEVIRKELAPNGYNRVAGFLTPEMQLNTSTHIVIGKSFSKFNAGSIDFVYKEAGSNKNGIGFNVWANGLNPDATGPYILFARANGFVGIGTSDPDHKLDVRGNVNITNEVTHTKLGINAIDEKYAFLRYSRNNKIRWDAGMLNSAETGENTGSDYYVRAFDDEGNSLSTPLWIARKTGFVGLSSSSINLPTERLDINAGNVRVRDLPNNTGAADTDKVVVVDNTGVLKSVERSSLVSTEIKATETTKICDENNAGTFYYKEKTVDGKKRGVMGFCTKQDDVYTWVYFGNGGNILQSAGSNQFDTL